MRVACVVIPHFPLQVERLLCPGLEGPLVIGGTPFDQAPVIDCSDQAGERGVRPGMPLSEASHLCPEAAFLPMRECGYDDAWEQVLYELGAFALRIESAQVGLAYLDVTRSSRLYKGEGRLGAALVSMLDRVCGLAAGVGMGNSRFLARQAAYRASPVLVIPPGAERRFLAPLPPDVLPLDEEIKERLALLGLTTLGRLATLTCAHLSSQFGRPGKALWEMAGGIDETGRIPKRPRQREVEKEAVADAPLETMDRIEQAMGGSLDAACAELARMGRSCRKIRIVLSLQSGGHLECSLMMKHATDAKRAMLERVMSALSSLAIETAITGFRLSLSGLSRTGEQEGLFKKRPGLAQTLEGVKEYLSARYGEPTLFRVEEGEKDSRLPERRYVFREV
jgi:nucleotidyltransferase/DNA polymerase involved in DNA repair